MTKPSSPYATPNTSQHNKPRESITSSTIGGTSVSRRSSTSSLSPSTSVLLSAAAARPTPSRSSSRSSSSYRKGQSSPILPQLSSSSLSSSTRNNKLEQIIQNFYTKTAHIILQSKIPNSKLQASNTTTGRRKLNKWFNITTNDCEKLKEELKFWKSIVKYQQDEEPPPMIIDIYVETTEPELLQEGDDTRGWHRLDLGLQQHDIQRILIESWTLSLTHPLPDFPVDLPSLYKRSIVFFRSLHSLIRLLPSHRLYQKLRGQESELSLGYRLSTSGVSPNDEITLDHPLTNIDTTGLYVFRDVVTPLGTFKLKLMYREHCQFDTKEESPLEGIDVGENFFTPTMTKYRQERSKETQSMENMTKPVPVFPTTSSTTSARNRLQYYRGSITPSRSNYPMVSTSSTNTVSPERRISAPLVSPFKSPSLSSSPQTELMFATTNIRSQTPETQIKQESVGRKTEFSSSFEKFYKSGSPNSSASSHIQRTGSSTNVIPADLTGISMTRRWSRTSDHSSINMESEEDEEDLEDFLKFVGARQELKLFQQHTSQPNFQGVKAYADLTIEPQQRKNQQNDNDTTKFLSHFRNIQETHNILSDSMSSSQHQLVRLPVTVEELPLQSSYESSSFTNKGLNVPANPSPLQNTESIAIHPTAIMPICLRRHKSCQSFHSKSIETPNDDEFFSYPRGQPHYQLTTAQPSNDNTTLSPLKNRQPPLPPPPNLPTRRSGSSGDDDSLVFKMSELGGCEEETTVVAPVNEGFYFGNEDFFQRLNNATKLNVSTEDESSIMRRALSSEGVATTATIGDALCDSSSKSDPVTGSRYYRSAFSQQKQEGTNLTHRLFFGEL